MLFRSKTALDRLYAGGSYSEAYKLAAKCLEQDRYGEAIESDLALGRERGVGNACDSTPNGPPAANPATPRSNCAQLRKKLKRAIAKGDKAKAKKLRAKLRKRGCLRR